MSTPPWWAIAVWVAAWVVIVAALAVAGVLH